MSSVSQGASDHAAVPKSEDHTALDLFDSVLDCSRFLRSSSRIGPTCSQVDGAQSKRLWKHASHLSDSGLQVALSKAKVSDCEHAR